MAQMAGKQKKITMENEDGTTYEYTLQHPGVRGSYTLRKKSKDEATGHIEEDKYFEQLMQTVIFTEKGKTNWEYWEEEEHAEHQMEVLKEANTFLIGKRT